MIPIYDTVPGRNPPIATWAILLANCGMFLLEISLPEHGLERLFYLFGIVPAPTRTPSGPPTWASPSTTIGPS